MSIRKASIRGRPTHRFCFTPAFSWFHSRSGGVHRAAVLQDDSRDGTVYTIRRRHHSRIARGVSVAARDARWRCGVDRRRNGDDLAEIYARYAGGYPYGLATVSSALMLSLIALVDTTPSPTRGKDGGDFVGCVHVRPAASAFSFMPAAPARLRARRAPLASCSCVQSGAARSAAATASATRVGLLARSFAMREIAVRLHVVGSACAAERKCLRAERCRPARRAVPALLCAA